MKKALLALAVGTVMTVASGVALANGGSFVPAAPHHTGGFYVGAGISRDTATFETTSNDAFVDGFGVLHTSASSVDLGANGIDGELLAGYGMTFVNRYTLAIEAFGDVSSLKGSQSFATTAVAPNGTVIASGNVNSEIKSNYTVGVSLLPGVKLTDNTTLYGRVGWVYSRFKADGSATSTTLQFVNGVFVPVTQSGSTSGSKNKSGIQLGVGMQTNVTNNVAIRGEWSWNRYGNLASGTAGGSIKPTVDKFTLAALYMFNS